jgi:hypothetical protein
MMIERVTRWEFLKDHEITDLKPQNLITLTITMDVPSTSVAPCSTRSGTTPPPLATSSSSSGGVLRVLKSMFAWYRDTRQGQDMLLSNRRCQNEKMALTSFLFPCLRLMMTLLLLYLPLISRPWRLSLTMMQMDPTASMKKKRKARKARTTTSDIFGTELHGRRIYLSMLFAVFIWIWLVRPLFSICWSCAHGF